MSPDLNEILDLAIDRRLRGVHTCLPGEIVSYSNASGTATVQPSVDVEITAGTWESLPPIPDVPVVQPFAGGAFLNFIPASGDRVLIHFCEQDPSGWLDDGESRPTVVRRHGLYAFATLGIRLSSAPSTGPAIGRDGGPVIGFGSSVVNLGTESAFDYVALASLVQAAMVLISAHVHESGPASPSSTLSAIGTAPYGATKVKAT